MGRCYRKHDYDVWSTTILVVSRVNVNNSLDFRSMTISRRCCWIEGISKVTQSEEFESFPENFAQFLPAAQSTLHCGLITPEQSKIRWMASNSLKINTWSVPTYRVENKIQHENRPIKLSAFIRFIARSPHSNHININRLPSPNNNQLNLSWRSSNSGVFGREFAFDKWFCEIWKWFCEIWKWKCVWVKSFRISRLRPPKVQSNSMIGSVIRGASFSRIQVILRQSALRNWVALPFINRISWNAMLNCWLIPLMIWGPMSIGSMWVAGSEYLGNMKLSSTFAGHQILLFGYSRGLSIPNHRRFRSRTGCRFGHDWRGPEEWPRNRENRTRLVCHQSRPQIAFVNDLSNVHRTKCRVSFGFSLFSSGFN